MRKILILLYLLLITQHIIAQIPGIKWHKTYNGGISADLFGVVEQTKIVLPLKRGGFLIGGQANCCVPGYHTSSSQEQGDYWLIKTDSIGNTLWQKAFGGTGFDILYHAEELSNGDIIAIGSSQSNDGDVDTLTGYRDTWVIYLTKEGNLKWQKSFLGDYEEEGYMIKQTQDKNFILMTRSFSYKPDANYNPIPEPWSSTALIIKIDSLGNKLWEKCYQFYNRDLNGRVIIPTDDGGYICGGYTRMDVYQPNHGFDEIILWKIDSNGTPQWHKSYGGSYHEYLSDLIITLDGNYLFVGATDSNNGDVLYNHNTPYNIYDSWIVKTDKTGNILWQKSMGGSGSESFNSVKENADGSFILSGKSQNSTDGDLAGLTSHGGFDGWIAKLSADGTIQWNKLIGGSSKDYLTSIGVLKNGDIVALGTTYSIDGDLQANDPFSTLWLTYLSCVNTISGKIFLDANNNEILDEGELLFRNSKIATIKNSDTLITFSPSGLFNINVDTGNYVVKPILAHNYYLSEPVEKTFGFMTYFNTDTANFAIQILPGKKDYSIYLFPLSVVRPASGVIYNLVVTNSGTEVLTNKTIKFVKNRFLSFEYALPVQRSINDDTIYWSIDKLEPNEYFVINIGLKLPTPPTVDIGDTIRTYATLIPTLLTDTPYDDSAFLLQIVQGSKDPNDKTENHAGTISKTNITNGDWLTYTIRFQNTGTDTAFNIVIRDTLDSKLDWGTLQMVDASHNYQLNINDGNICTWYFNDVLVPDSNINEAASHGYISYRIKPKSIVIAGDVINNTASIYFDYNLPVQTNTEKTIVANDIVLPLQLLSFAASRNGATNLLKWRTAQEINTNRFEIQRSNNGTDFSTLGALRSFKNGKSQNDYAYTDAQPAKAVNYYRLKLIDNDGKFTYSGIRTINNTGNFDITVYPNPANQNISLSFNTEKSMNVQVEIVNAEGKKVYSSKIQLPYGQSAKHINIALLGSGDYFIRCSSGEGQTGVRFVKQ